MEVIGAPTPEGFDWFQAEMLSMGFQIIEGKQIQQDFIRLKLQKKIRKVEGHEVGFQYSNGTYVVKVWSTYLLKEGKLRDMGTDAGWVVTTKGDKPVYNAKYFTRKNKNFFFDMKEYARINKYKILNTPLCPCESCEKEMEIHRKKHGGGYLWICITPEKHEKPRYRRWDYGLSDLDKDFLGIRRKKTQVYKKKNQKALKEIGKPLPIPKTTTRKVREIGRLENLKN